MNNIIVLDNPKSWALDIPEAEIVTARSYLTDERYSKLRKTRVFNLCRSYKYQSTGYYVSLLAEARGHRPLPSVMTIQDLKSQSMVRFVSDELDNAIQKNLRPIQSERFTLSIYFGRNLAKRYDALSQKLFSQFQAPLLQAQFSRTAGHWNLQSIQPVSTGQIPEEHTDFIVGVSQEYFARRRPVNLKRNETRFDLAILQNPQEPFPPSDERALQKFVKAAGNLDFSVELITRDDYGRLAEFDALFIRETTSVNHHTYRFARRAATEGLVVIDDPESILKCTNKVYLAELLGRNGIAIPKTLIISEKNDERILKELGLPCIIKQPDSSFSQGVMKVDTEEELAKGLAKLFESSDLVIAQKFMPTDFDWRVGILNQKPLYVCKYYMARKHWQIYQRSESGKTYSGKADHLAVDQTPEKVIATALKAANLIGNGLYGVDLKQKGENVYIIEINDNPSIDAGVEDEVLKEGLYHQIMEEILRRIEQKKGISK